MASSPVLNPPIPYVGEVEGGLVPGKMVRVQGQTPADAVRFAINYQLGPTLNPRDDIAIHVSPRFSEGFITRNHISSMSWGMEENEGPMSIRPGEEFEILLLCDHHSYKIAINGRHFAEFVHRLPYQRVTHLVIDGDVEVNSIVYEVVSVDPPSPPRATPVPDVPPANFGPPPPGGLYPNLTPEAPGYGPPPPGGYGPPPGGYNPPGPYGYQPGYEKPEEEDAFGGCLDKVGLALGGLVAAGGVAAAMHAMNKKKEDSGDQEKDHEKSDASKHSSESGLGSLGSLGAALASSLASNALSNTHAQQGYPAQSSGGGLMGSLLGAIGGATHQPSQAPPPPSSDPLSGAIGSILGGVLGGGGNQPPPYQASGGYGGYQPSGGYPGGYGQPQQQQGSGGSDLLSGIGSAIGSSLLSSALGSFGKHSKEKPHGENHSPPPKYSSPTSPPPSQPTPDNSSGKLTAEEISKGLGLD